MIKVPINGLNATIEDIVAPIQRNLPLGHVSEKVLTMLASKAERDTFFSSFSLSQK